MSIPEEPPPGPPPNAIGRALGAVPIGQAQQLTEATAQKIVALIENSQPIRRLRASQIASAFLGAIGFSLFIFGVERAAEDIPFVSNPYGSIVVGIMFLSATGLLLRRLAAGE